MEEITMPWITYVEIIHNYISIIIRNMLDNIWPARD